jgi:hypothetical protein
MPYFPDVPKIKYEGPDSKNPLAYRHYNPDELVEDKPIRDHLRFKESYWHTHPSEVGSATIECRMPFEDVAAMAYAREEAAPTGLIPARAFCTRKALIHRKGGMTDVDLSFGLAEHAVQERRQRTPGVRFCFRPSENRKEVEPSVWNAGKRSPTFREERRLS